MRIFKEHATKIINFDKKKMIPLTNKQQESYEKTKIRYICKKKVGTKNTNVNMLLMVEKGFRGRIQKMQKLIINT